MHALEPDPEQRNRWKRMTTGGGVAVGIAGAFFFVAQNVEPARRLMPEILQIAVVDDIPPPPPKDIPPPPPPPPPPKNKRAEPEQQEKSVEQPPPDQEPQETSEAEAGLNADSFGEGSGGVSFRTGKTQMGDPNKVAAKQLVEAPKIFSKPEKLAPARAIDPVLPTYPERARKLNIEGFVVLEAEIDERGVLTGLRVRESLEKNLDDTALASVRRWRFQPAMLAGRAMASTRLIRIRFELD